MQHKITDRQNLHLYATGEVASCKHFSLHMPHYIKKKKELWDLNVKGKYIRIKKGRVKCQLALKFLLRTKLSDYGTSTTTEDI